MAPSCPPDEDGNPVDDCVAAYMPLYFVFLGLLAGALTTWAQQRFAPWIPYTALMFIEGILLGVLHFATEEGLGDISISVSAWISIDPFLLGAVFLPALLASDALRLDWHKFTAQALWPSTVLAIPGVVASGTLMGTVAFYFLDYGWSWYACFLFGSVMGATDPVSIVAMLESSGAPQRLTLIMASESHIADLTVLVFFKFFLEIVTKGSELVEKPAEAAAFFARFILIAPIVGLVFGFGGYYLIKQSVSPTRNSDVLTQIALTIVVAYLSFLVSEHNFASNGIIATVVAAWVLAKYAWPKFAKRETIENVWHAIEYIGNTIIFLLAGTILGGAVFNTAVVQTNLEWRDVLNALVMWGFLYASRLGIVLVFYPVLYYVSGRRFSPAEAVATVAGGIRGAVTVTLGIIVLNTSENSLFTEELKVHFGQDYQVALGKFFFIVGTLVLLSITVNQMTFSFVLRLLRLNKDTRAQEKLHDHVRHRVRKNAYALLEKAREDPTYRQVPVEKIQALVASTRLGGDGNTVRSGVGATLRRRLFRKGGGQEESDDTVQTGMGGGDNEAASVPATVVTQPEVPARAIDPATVMLADCDAKLLSEVRGVFLRAVRAQYWEQMRQGKLPKKSAAAMVLLNAVDIADDDTTKKLDDLEPLKLKRRMDEPHTMEHAFDKMDACLPACITVDNYVQSRYTSARRELTVYLATCFLEAHLEAEKKIAEYVGEDESIDTPEEAYVIKESRALRAEVEALLDAAEEEDAEVVEHVHTIKVANVIIENQRLYLETLAEEGIIDPMFLEEQMEAVRADQTRIARARKALFRKLASERAADQYSAAGKAKSAAKARAAVDADDQA